jgi:hypothetical protein
MMHEAIGQQRSFNLIHLESMFKVDLLTGGLEGPYGTGLPTVAELSWI